MQDDLAVSPYAKFTGTIYSDENNAGFKSDARCGNAKKAKPANAAPDMTADADLESPPMAPSETENPSVLERE